MTMRSRDSRMSRRDWVFVLCCTVLGTIFYSTVIVLLLKPYVPESVFDFLNIWVTITCIPVLIWLGRKYVMDRKGDLK